MTYIDIGVIVIVLILGIRGLTNGLIHEIMGVIGVVLGIYLASRYCVEVGHYIELAGLEFQNHTILWTLGFIIILSVIWIGFLVLGAIIARFIVMRELAIINYFGGYIFAALKYFVILCLVVYALSQIGFLKQPIKDFTKGSIVYSMMIEITEKIISLESVENTLKEIQVKKLPNETLKDTTKNITTTIKDIGSDVKENIENIMKQEASSAIAKEFKKNN